MLPIIQKNNVQCLNLSVKTLQQNKPIIKELSTIKCLTLRLSSDSEANCNTLMNYISEAGNCFDLVELNLVNIEKSVKLLLNDNILAFIKGQKETLSRLSITNFEFQAKDALNILNCNLHNLSSLEITQCGAPLQAAKSVQ